MSYKLLLPLLISLVFHPSHIQAKEQITNFLDFKFETTDVYAKAFCDQDNELNVHYQYLMSCNSRISIYPRKKEQNCYNTDTPFKEFFKEFDLKLKNYSVIYKENFGYIPLGYYCMTVKTFDTSCTTDLTYYSNTFKIDKNCSGNLNENFTTSTDLTWPFDNHYEQVDRSGNRTDVHLYFQQSSEKLSIQTYIFTVEPFEHHLNPNFKVTRKLVTRQPNAKQRVVIIEDLKPMKYLVYAQGIGGVCTMEGCNKKYTIVNVTEQVQTNTSIKIHNVPVETQNGKKYLIKIVTGLFSCLLLIFLLAFSVHVFIKRQKRSRNTQGNTENTSETTAGTAVDTAPQQHTVPPKKPIVLIIFYKECEEFVEAMTTLLIKEGCKVHGFHRVTTLALVAISRTRIYSLLPENEIDGRPMKVIFLPTPVVLQTGNNTDEENEGLSNEGRNLETFLENMIYNNWKEIARNTIVLTLRNEKINTKVNTGVVYKFLESPEGPEEVYKFVFGITEKILECCWSQKFKEKNDLVKALYDTADKVTRNLQSSES